VFELSAIVKDYHCEIMKAILIVFVVNALSTRSKISSYFRSLLIWRLVCLPVRAAQRQATELTTPLVWHGGSALDVRFMLLNYGLGSSWRGFGLRSSDW